LWNLPKIKNETTASLRLFQALPIPGQVLTEKLLGALACRLRSNG